MVFLDLVATLVCQFDPTWYKSDPQVDDLYPKRLEVTWAKTTDFRLQLVLGLV